ncbi:MAG: protein TolR [Candidatus Paracaedibacteraceae bacterium]|nr:protein TolR [Candidatus Paracaedibacteraceae bacterium]
MASNLSHNSSIRGRRRRSFRPSSDINVTPLVDVMLVLLIIFMVTAPMMTVGVPVDLPKTQAAQMNDQVEPLVVSIDVNGQTFFQETELPLPEILIKLQAAAEGKPDTKIYVRGDKKLPYGQIMETMGAIAAAGFSRVSLIAELPTPPTLTRSQKSEQVASAHKKPTSSKPDATLSNKAVLTQRRIVPTAKSANALPAKPSLPPSPLKQTR